MLFIRAIKKTFSLDSRSLSLFRVLVSFILINDFLFTRLPYFTLFYTDKGILPLKELFGHKYWGTASSLNFISSDSTYQFALFILALVFFFMMLIGYKTRWALLGSWILLVSFQARNFLIFNSGDMLLGLMLFWSLGLPLNRHFSIDSALENRKGEHIFSLNSVFFIFQILLVYSFAYLAKTDAIWKTGQAVYYALMLDAFRTAWGDILLQYERVMYILSHFTYYIVEGTVLLLFVLFGFLWRFKLILIVLMCFFHLSLNLFLHLGLFSYICVAGWLAFLPSEFWEKLKNFLPGRKNPLTVYYDEHCSFCKKSVYLLRTFFILPHVNVAEAQSDKTAQFEMEKRNSWLVFSEKTGWQGRWKAGVILLSYSPLFFYLKPVLGLKIFSVVGDWLYQQVAGNRNRLGYFLPTLQTIKPIRSKLLSILLSGFFYFCFLFVLLWNVRSTDFKYYEKYFSEKWNGVASFFHLYQHWNMFAPKPLSYTGWVILSAVQSNNNVETKIDLWKKGSPLTMEKPYRYDMTFPVFRLRKMFGNFVSKRNNKYVQHYLVYLCDEWNKKPGYNIKSIEFIFMKQVIPPQGKHLPKPEKIIIQQKNCKP